MDRGAHNPTPRAHPTRMDALAWSDEHFENGDFRRDLARRLSAQTRSGAHGVRMAAWRYLAEQIEPSLQSAGFTVEVIENDHAPDCPFLLAARLENPALPTVLLYAHGDIAAESRPRSSGLAPLIVQGDRWYGAGIADSKAQHAVTLAALGHVIEARRGQLGYNVKILFEMGEEQGSPGLYEFCEAERDQLAADVLIACDGARLSTSRPLIALGSRGFVRFIVEFGDISIRSDLRANFYTLPAILSAATRSVSRLARQGQDARDERGSPTAEVKAILRPQTPNQPIRAIIDCRYTHETELEWLATEITQQLTQLGLANVSIARAAEPAASPARSDPNNPWMQAIAQSLQATAGIAPTILPQFSGVTTSDIFSDVLGLPTIWIPHAPPGSGRHGGHDHVLGSLLREGLQVMTGVFWDLGECEVPAARRKGCAPTLVLVSNRE